MNSWPRAACRSTSPRRSPGSPRPAPAASTATSCGSAARACSAPDDRPARADRTPSRRALLPAACRSRAGPQRPATRLPDVELTRTGVAVDREHLAAYDRVCGFRLGDALPADLPARARLPAGDGLMTAPDFPFGCSGWCTSATGSTSTGRSRRRAARPRGARGEPAPHDRGRQFDVVAEASVDGEVVWRGVSTYLHRERRRGRGGAARRATAPAPPAADRAVAGARRRRPPLRRGLRRPQPDPPARAGREAVRLPAPDRARHVDEGPLPGRAGGPAARRVHGRRRFKLPVLLPSTVDFSAACPDGGFALHDCAARAEPHLAGSLVR